MTQQRSHHSCEGISALIPWFVNGTIGENDRQRLEAHLEQCAVCRGELAQDRRVHQEMTAEPAVEYMPASSLKRLQALLDAIDGAAAPAIGKAAAGNSGRRAIPWQGLMAASVAIMAVVLGLLAAEHWQAGAHGARPGYYTVTTAAPHAPGEVIRAVFSPKITLVELQALLDEAQLRIISGPTEAGVYSLAAKSGLPVSSSLALLRGHSKVRFAESTQPMDVPDDAR